MREIDKDELELLRKKVEIAKRESDNDKFSRRRNIVKEENNNINIDAKKIKKEKSKKEKIKKEKIKKENKQNTKEIKFQSFTFMKDEEKKDINEDRKIKQNKKQKVKKEKEPFSAKRFLIKLGIMIVIAIFVTILGFYFLDRAIYNLNNVNLLDTPIKGLQSDINKGIKIEDTMSSVQYTYNNKYYTYLSEGKVYINDLVSSENLVIVENANPICYYNLLYDKNRIFYITSEDSTYSTTLQIWTYDIASGETSEYNEFNVSGFTRIKDLEYSPLVNIIYLNVERNSGGYTENVVYRIDLFNNMGRYASNMIVNKMVMLKLTENLYFEDGNGTIYYSGYPLRIFNEGVDLIGLDLNDKVYFISSDRTKIYVVSGRQILATIDLEDTNPITWYSDNTNVYLVYQDYVCCISAGEPLRKVGKMSRYVTFQTIKGSTMYVRTNDNRVVKVELDLK